jgi:hypothetical protein
LLKPASDPRKLLDIVAILNIHLEVHYRHYETRSKGEERELIRKWGKSLAARSAQIKQKDYGAERGEC